MNPVTYTDYSMDARLLKVIAMGVEPGNYLEVFLADGDLIHADIKGGWTSTLSLGFLGRCDPYVCVIGKRERANEVILEEIKSILNRKGMEYDVQDQLYYA